MHRLGTAILTLTLASGTVWAQTSGQSGGKSEQSAVSVVSGGVGQTARDNMRSQNPPHNVKMVFSLNTGNYVSDVHVKVTDGAGKTVIDNVSDGPWLFAQLPPGNYTATATYADKPVIQRFSVGKSGIKTAQFRWPASVEQTAVGSNASDGGGQLLGTGPQEPPR